VHRPLHTDTASPPHRRAHQRLADIMATGSAATLALGLVGCAQLAPAPAVAPAAAAPLRFASDLRCGERTLQFGVGRRDGRDVPQLAVGARRIDLKQVVSASGARYEGIDDPRSSVWNKGRRAIVVLDGETLPECTIEHSGSGITPNAPATAGPAPAIAADLRARGNKPSWSLDLGKTLRFSTLMLSVEGTAPPARIVDGVRRHEGIVQGRAIVVEVRAQRCTDSMSGMPHPQTVQVQFDGQLFRGCGGRPIDLLLGAEWVIEDIGGAGLVDRSRATLRFGDDGKVGGRASCNIFTGSYTLTGESLAFGKSAGTMMACAPALMEQERRLLDLLQAVHRFEISDSGALVLVTPDNRRITARRAG
jgi:heat shock protein HslJ/membrane-bound inhibitor of C-type lysozyme